MRFHAVLLALLALPACRADAAGTAPPDDTAQSPHTESTAAQAAPVKAPRPPDHALVRGATGCQLWDPGLAPKNVTCPGAPTELEDGELVEWNADGTCTRRGGLPARQGQVACPPLADLKAAAPLPNPQNVPDPKGGPLGAKP